MAHRGHTTRSWIAVAVAVVVLVIAAAPSDSQILDDTEPTTPTTGSTTTTAPQSPRTSTTSPSTTSTTSTTTTTLLPTNSTTTTVPDSEGGPDSPPGSTPGGPDFPEGGADDGEAGDGGVPGEGGEAGEGDVATPRTTPPEAQRIINSVVRSRPNSSAALAEAVGALTDLGLSREEAIRIGFGRFPVAGVAKYSHDWLYPRWGPGFRFHKGTDVFAPYGTPLRASVDGIATAKTSQLGGLSVKVTTPDGTYFYYAHLSALVDGFVSGMAVETGDIVGFVGDSGNAKGGSPHLHIGIYPRGGPATDPKPVLDQFLADAIERLPSVVEQVRANASARPTAVALAPVTPRSMLATSLLRPRTQLADAVEVPTEILYQASANPSAGGASVAQAEAEHLAASIDWAEWQSRSDLGRDLLRRTEAVLRLALGTRGTVDPDGGTDGATDGETAGGR